MIKVIKDSTNIEVRCDKCDKGIIGTTPDARLKGWDIPKKNVELDKSTGIYSYEGEVLCPDCNANDEKPKTTQEKANSEAEKMADDAVEKAYTDYCSDSLIRRKTWIKRFVDLGMIEENTGVSKYFPRINKALTVTNRIIDTETDAELTLGIAKTAKDIKDFDILEQKEKAKIAKLQKEALKKEPRNVPVGQAISDYVINAEKNYLVFGCEKIYGESELASAIKAHPIAMDGKQVIEVVGDIKMITVEQKISFEIG